MRIGSGSYLSSRREGHNANNRHHHERFTSSQSRERQRIASHYFNLNEKLEWQNPCGGNHVPPDPNWQPPKPTLSDEIAALENVKKHIEPALQDIENQIREEELADPLGRWSKHEENYSFLPALNDTQNSQGASESTPRVKRRPQQWHRDIQVFIGAFQYLHKQQLLVDNDSNNGTDTSKMLFDLMTNAKSLLCEIEILVNNTAHNLRKPRGRTEMGNILKFEVKNPSSTSRYLDRRFTNEKYKQYVSELLHVVTRRFERKKLNHHLQSIGEPLVGKSASRQRNHRRKNNNRLGLSNESSRRRKGNQSNMRNSESNQRIRGNNSKNRENRPHNKRQRLNTGIRRQKKLNMTTSTTTPPRIFTML
uniref:CSON004570 protein n=1 Tax=Culicoides sonorensis TaxID=179676 RepID=A0A336MP96_CULSO